MAIREFCPALMCVVTEYCCSMRKAENWCNDEICRVRLPVEQAEDLFEIDLKEV